MAAVELINTPLITDANLVSYYRFNTGALTTDYKGVNTLTNGGSVAETASGKFGYSINYPSQTQTGVMYRDANYGIAVDTAFSVSFWVKVNVVPSETYPYYYYDWFTKVLNSSGTINQTFDVHYFNQTGTKRIRLYVNSSGTPGSYVWYDTDLGTTDWHHIVLNVFGNGTASVYLDGNTTPICTQTGITGYNNDGGGTITTLTVGMDRGNYWSDACAIDDFAIFNRVLTTEEIHAIANGTWLTTNTLKNYRNHRLSFGTP